MGPKELSHSYSRAQRAHPLSLNLTLLQYTMHCSLIFWDRCLLPRAQARIVSITSSKLGRAVISLLFSSFFSLRSLPPGSRLQPRASSDDGIEVLRPPSGSTRGSHFLPMGLSSPFCAPPGSSGPKTRIFFRPKAPPTFWSVSCRRPIVFTVTKV